MLRATLLLSFVLLLQSCTFGPKLVPEMRFIESTKSFDTTTQSYAWICENHPVSVPIDGLDSELKYSLVLETENDVNVYVARTKNGKCGLYFLSGQETEYFGAEVYIVLAPHNENHALNAAMDDRVVEEFVSNACLRPTRFTPQELDCSFLEEEGAMPNVDAFSPFWKLTVYRSQRGNLHVPGAIAFVQGALVSIDW